MLSLDLSVAIAAALLIALGLLWKSWRDLKQVEQRHRATEAELRRVMGSISDCLWSVEIRDAAHRVIYVSPVIEQITGRSPSYFAEFEDWLSVVHPDDRARVQEVVRNTFLSEVAGLTVVYRIVRPDGEVRWIRTAVRATRGSDGAIRLHGVDSDVSGQREADEALRKAKEELQAVIEASPLAIYRLDPDGNVESWNRAAERIFGWTEQEVLHRRLPFVPEDEIEGFYGRLEQNRRGVPLDGFEARRLRKDGSGVDVSIWSAPLRDPSGVVYGFVNLAADVTDRVQLQQQLHQSQKMEAIGRLAGGVAHDFNNLLTVITGYGHMLLGDLQPASEEAGGLEEILKAADRASALTNQLLAFSRRQVVQPRILDLNVLVKDLDNMLRRVIGEDIHFETRLAPDLWKIRADSGHMQQILMNLVVNSRDAMPSGGTLTIETANCEMVSTHGQPAQYCSLSVRDTGIGMDEETKLHAFEPFFTTKEQGKGTGLGLSTVYGIVKQAGGEVAIASKPGQGTTFEIYLPRVADSVEQPEAPEETSGAAGGTETILLVEDEPGVRRLVRELLSGQGYTILEAAAPGEALELFRNRANRIDLLLTDLVMPQMSGRELAAMLAAMQPRLRVLFMSGYPEGSAVNGSSGISDSEYLKKPFPPGELARKVRAALDSRAGRAAVR